MLRRTLPLFKEAVTSATASTSTSSAAPSSSSSSYNRLLSSLTAHIDPATLPPAVARHSTPHKNLYQHLSTLPNDGVGLKVRQRRWLAKGLDAPANVDLKQVWRQRTQNGTVNLVKEDGRKMPIENDSSKEREHLCYWLVSKVRLKDGGNHGKAWGKLFWRGKQVSQRDEPIRGGLKYFWDSAK